MYSLHLNEKYSEMTPAYILSINYFIDSHQRVLLVLLILNIITKPKLFLMKCIPALCVFHIFVNLQNTVYC